MEIQSGNSVCVSHMRGRDPSTGANHVLPPRVRKLRWRVGPRQGHGDSEVGRGCPKRWFNCPENRICFLCFIPDWLKNMASFPMCHNPLRKIHLRIGLDLLLVHLAYLRSTSVFQVVPRSRGCCSEKDGLSRIPGA